MSRAIEAMELTDRASATQRPFVRPRVRLGLLQDRSIGPRLEQTAHGRSLTSQSLPGRVHCGPCRHPSAASRQEGLRLAVELSIRQSWSWPPFLSFFFFLFSGKLCFPMMACFGFNARRRQGRLRACTTPGRADRLVSASSAHFLIRSTAVVGVPARHEGAAV